MAWQHQWSKHPAVRTADQLSLGERAADKMRNGMGSWPFVFVFFAVMISWAVVNGVRHVGGGSGFDPYPFILLNLALSTIAALQAPVIMMSQNRQSAKDKLLAENDYQVNLKAEMEIGALMRGHAEMMARIALIERSITKRVSDATDPGRTRVTSDVVGSRSTE